ncbi:MAG: M3 family metallopeptidase [Prevotellaceae bacterium]|jgi:peptidyl-dipeptidase Dcp|nr:M3 family metallopeptidase [Prevotellaceae bacterium]
MKKILFLTLAIILMSCNKHQNPFLKTWDNEFGLPPFSEITNADYLPALDEGIRQHSAEIQAIINKPDAPTFENTIEPFDHSGELLGKVVGVLFNLSETNSNDELDKIVLTATEKLSEHNDNIFMNHELFKRVEVVYNNSANLQSVEQQQVVEKIYRKFHRNGIGLDAEKQARLREINKQLSVLEQTFGNNLLAEVNDFQLVIDNEADLAGLPQSVRDAAAEDAKNAKLKEKWLFGLQVPSYIPFMQYSEKRDLREKMFKAYSSKANHGNEHDNRQVILNIMKLRIEKANLLGFNTPAEWILQETLAKNPATVNKFLTDLMTAANAKAKEEVAEMQKIIDDENGGFQLAAWDWAFYAEKLRVKKYDLNEDEIKPYFQMEKVRDGVFYCASKLYDIKFEPLKNAPIYYPEVEAFKILNPDGSLVGILYTDYYPRKSKRGGAWMNNFREQQVIDGVDVRPVIVNVGNFTKPTSEKPSLLTIDEVETMFHEFGHALHGLLSKCHYSTVAGTNTPRDFVEMPSQINESWAFQPEVLAVYAKHYKTGEVIPDSLIAKINNSATFNQGFMLTELVAAAILDMNWHEITSIDSIDVEKFEQESIKKMGLIDEIIPRYRSTYFNHIFNSGYSAGYYSYLWTEWLAKDAFELFLERGDVFDPATAKSFKENILEKGSSGDLMELYRKFRGQNPSIEPMLKSRGLK